MGVYDVLAIAGIILMVYGILGKKIKGMEAKEYKLFTEPLDLWQRIILFILGFALTLIVILPILGIKLLQVEGTKTPTSLVNCSQVASFEITSPDGVRGNVTTPTALPGVPRTTKVSWSPADCEMTIEFYQGGQKVGEHKSAQSGTIDLTSLPPGWTQIKLWQPNGKQEADSIHAVLLP